jgi:ankyrin repeat protein
MKVRLGAWSWDTTTGEELRVGAGLAEPYDATWCAVEFFESSGHILQLLLQSRSANTLYLGRSLLHHAILCGNPGAVQTLLSYGADCNLPVKTSRKQHEFRPVHLASRLGHAKILQILISNGCEIDTRTENSDTALIICARHRQEECIRVLVSSGADLGALNCGGESAGLVASSTQWGAGFRRTVIDVIRAGIIPKTTDPNIFSPLLFSAKCGDVAAVNVLLTQPEIDINEHDGDGFTPVMIAAKEGHVDAFRVLLFAGANVRLCNQYGESAITYCQSSKRRDLFEQVMLQFALENGAAGGFYALHCAARRGDLAAVRSLVGKCGDVNLPDGDGYTPLMLAAREGHGTVCELLISHGAKCDIKTSRGETVLSLAKENDKFGNTAVNVILDEISRVLVLRGGQVKKHTKNGKGSPHYKFLKMVMPTNVLSWGNSCRRNVVCQETKVGPSSSFVKNRGRRGDVNDPGLFRVVTMEGKEVHFVCEGGNEVAELWVRGIRLVTKAAVGSKND